MSCRKATELLSASLDRPLTRMERVRLRVHLVICTACRRYRRQIQAIDFALQRAVGGDAVASVDDTLALGDEARTRMEQAIEDGA